MHIHTHLQCGQYIAREVAMVEPDSLILLAELNAHTQELDWAFTDKVDEASSRVYSTLDVLRMQNAVTGGIFHKDFSSSSKKTPTAATETQAFQSSTSSTSSSNHSQEAHQSRHHPIAVSGRRIELALSGNAALASLMENAVVFRALLTDMRIFARMSPESKTSVINSLREHGQIVGMCGDGA